MIYTITINDKEVIECDNKTMANRIIEKAKKQGKTVDVSEIGVENYNKTKHHSAYHYKSKDTSIY